MLKIRRLPKPVIGSINGVAAGGGFSLALACDLRIASEEARLVMAFARIGATADGGSTYLLPRIVGQARAMEIYLTNQVLTAQRALEMGLVNEVVPATELAQRTAELAQRLASGPTAAFARTKALMEAGWTSDLASQMKGEAEALANMGHTDDFREGVSAFVNKGTPQFQGQ